MDSDLSVAAEPFHLPASAFCCFSIFSRRPSKESILVLIWVSSFLMVCNSSDFTGKGGKGQKATESQRLHDSLRTHLVDTPCFPKTAPNHTGCSQSLVTSSDPGLPHDGARYSCSPLGEHLILCFSLKVMRRDRGASKAFINDYMILTSVLASGRVSLLCHGVRLRPGLIMTVV